VPPAIAEALRRHGLRVEPAGGVYDVEVARVASLGAEDGRAILEAARVGEVSVQWREEARRAPEGWSRVDTEQPLGAIAVYLCEPESDDGAAGGQSLLAAIANAIPRDRSRRVTMPPSSISRPTSA
jgi:hypothetical protein